MPKVHETFYDNGNRRGERYVTHTSLHRKDGPAAISWYENGQLMYEEYYLHGDRHREDGPAVLFWQDNGLLVEEEYYVAGKRHREDGPALTGWQEDADAGVEPDIVYQYFYLNDKEVNVYDVLDEKAAFEWVLTHD